MYADDWCHTQTCSKVFKGLSKTLIDNEANLYRMKQAFYYDPSADPALIQVNYNIGEWLP